MQRPCRSSKPKTLERNNQNHRQRLVQLVQRCAGRLQGRAARIVLSTGLEYNYNDLLYARGGYFYEAPDKGDRQYVSLGLGVRYQVFGIDGTYLVPTGNAHQKQPPGPNHSHRPALQPEQAGRCLR